MSTGRGAVTTWSGPLICKITDNVDNVHDNAECGSGLADGRLRGRDLQGPMLGAQRRIEGRIGQILGEVPRGHPKSEDVQISTLAILDDHQRRDFRLLAGSVLTCSSDRISGAWRAAWSWVFPLPLSPLIR